MLFTEPLRRGERVRCCVITAPGGHGKTHMAEQLVSDAAWPEGSAVLVRGELADGETDLGSATIVVVDGADAASPAVLRQLRTEALSTGSERSLLFFARRIGDSSELAELAALADGDQRLGALEPLSPVDLAEVIPTSSSLDAVALAELTGSIPIHLDRLRRAWDEHGWPEGDDVVDIPDSFTRHVGAQLGRLGPDERIRLGVLALTRSPMDDRTTDDVVRALIDAGLVDANGLVPEAVARSVEVALSVEERDEAVRLAGADLLEVDPVRAVVVAETAATPPPWAAIAMAAAGRFADATRLLEAGESSQDGSTLAAAAHIAGGESRWSDAARYASAIREHPYWSTARRDAVARLYRALAGEDPGADTDEAIDPTEPTTSFIEEAVRSFVDTLAPEVDTARLGQKLRALVRQAPNQRPTLDIAVSPSELAAVAALLSGEFDIARSLVEKSAEVSERSELTDSFDRWVGLRAGVVDTTDVAGNGSVDRSEVIASEVLSLATRVLDSRRSGDLADQAGVLEEVRGVSSALSFDVLTFDAVCELLLGAQRIDARREARSIAAGLDALVEDLGRPGLWEVRRRWNRVESAIAGGDMEALQAASSDLAAVAHIGPGAPLAAAAQQWVRVFAGQLDKGSLERCLDDLESHGYVWEAAALAGQAAIRTSNAEMAKELLQRGREYRQAAPEAKITSPAGLSEREIEIGQLVLAGHSYKEIGAMCFISPKTVEHHISHIRQKLSAVGVSRAEFRAALEADLSPA